MAAVYLASVMWLHVKFRMDLSNRIFCMHLTHRGLEVHLICLLYLESSEHEVCHNPAYITMGGVTYVVPHQSCVRESWPTDMLNTVVGVWNLNSLLETHGRGLVDTGGRGCGTAQHEGSVKDLQKHSTINHRSLQGQEIRGKRSSMLHVHNRCVMD